MRSMIRMKIYSILMMVLSVFFMTVCATAAEDAKHLFILSGQSNMERLKAEESFIPEVIQLFGEQYILVVKDAHSGTAIRAWDKDWKVANGWKPLDDFKGDKALTEPKASGERYDELMGKVNAAIEGQKIKSITLVWMQGERDAREGHSRSYAKSLRNLYNRMCKDLGRGNINFVIGRISDFDMKNEKYPDWTKIRNVQQNFVKSSPRFALVNTDDYNGEDNDLHCTPEGYKALGKAFADKAAELIKVNDPKYIKAQYEAQFDNDLPKVIIWGDSISLGYKAAVIEALKGKAVVVRKSTGTTGNALENVDTWLAERKWDIIHFNNGLHDLCYRHPDSKVYGNRDKINGTIATTPEEYEKNLEKIVKILKKSGAKLIWASTTYVPEGEAGRVFGDDLIYNKTAEKVMKKYDITINDLNATSRKIHPKYGSKGDVHYNKDGSNILAEQVTQAILKKLNEK